MAAFDPHRAVRPAFRRLGVDATLDPDGAASPVRLVPVMGDQFVDVGEINLAEEGILFAVIAADLGGYGKNAEFEVNGVRRVIKSKPKNRDPRGVVKLIDSFEKVS